jgi:hypothetical protein
MQSLADRAAETLARHPAPALPLDELVDQVRDGGAVVGPEVLLRALEARPDLFRVLDPWRGPWRCTSLRTRASCVGRWPQWVVGLGPHPRADGPGARLKASLAWLGRTVDDRSVLDLVRWLGMVREGERLNRGGVRQEPPAA